MYSLTMVSNSTAIKDYAAHGTTIKHQAYKSILKLIHGHASHQAVVHEVAMPLTSL